MGFAPNGCRRAAMKNPQGFDAALEWVFQHMSDPDFDAPIEAPAPAAGGAPAASAASEESIAMLESMGFSRPQVLKALKATNNNVERAADWIFSHMDTMDADDDAPAPAAAAAPADNMSDHSGKYRLKAIISHMGTSAHCGHYVAHVRKDGRWVLYNDEKVSVSENPPFDLGYLYVYESV